MSVEASIHAIPLHPRWTYAKPTRADKTLVAILVAELRSGLIHAQQIPARWISVALK